MKIDEIVSTKITGVVVEDDFGTKINLTKKNIISIDMDNYECSARCISRKSKLTVKFMFFDVDYATIQVFDQEAERLYKSLMKIV